MSGHRIATLLLACCAAMQTDAATFTANNFSDLNDTSPGDGVCNVGNGTCSFRAAAQEAMALAGPDIIMLSAGTHNLTQTYNCGGPTCGLFVELRPGVKVIGAGVGST